MTLPHNNATARVLVDGLAICCYNRGEKKWDIAFLHHPDNPAHTLSLVVDDVAVNIDPKIAHSIKFETVDPQTPTRPGYQNGFFDPLGHRPDRKSQPANDDERENFRWTIDLEDTSDVIKETVRLKKPAFPVTRAFIQNGVFYTTARSPKDLYLIPDTGKPEDNPNITDPTQFLLGRTNDEIGADIFCAPASGKVIIKVDGNTPLELPHRPGKPWKVCLTNLCTKPINTGQKFEKGDFQLFYSVLDGFTQRYAIWGEPVDKMRACGQVTFRSGRTDCDTVFMGQTQTLDPLFT